MATLSVEKGERCIFKYDHAKSQLSPNNFVKKLPVQFFNLTHTDLDRFQKHALLRMCPGDHYNLREKQITYKNAT
jgi:ferredoxin-like protein FixX